MRSCSAAWGKVTFYTFPLASFHFPSVFLKVGWKYFAVEIHETTFWFNCKCIHLYFGCAKERKLRKLDFPFRPQAICIIRWQEKLYFTLSNISRSEKSNFFIAWKIFFSLFAGAEWCKAWRVKLISRTDGLWGKSLSN